MSDSDSDDMPPLEDMRPQFFDTEIGRHPPVKTAHGGAISGNDNREVIMKKTDNSKILNPESVKKSKADENSFGFARGFLSGGKKPKKSDIIKPKTKVFGQDLVFDEVQSKMKDLITKDPKAWCNDDLIKKVEDNKTMMSQLDDPEVAKALEWMQRDPKAASEYYTKNRPEIMEMFKSFTSMLGGHMSTLDKDKSKKEEILKKPKIQELVKYLKEHPDRANSMVRGSTDPEFRDDVRFLLSTGGIKWSK
jgi:hypothetical protein